MQNNNRIPAHNTQKKQATPAKFILGLLLDAIGMLSYAIPLLGETFDIIWAPVAWFAMTLMYKDSVGKTASIIAFIEEIVPGLDFIPTFTITWFYQWYLDKKQDL